MALVFKSNQRAQRTVKAFESDIDLINERAKLLGCSAAEVIHEMCEELRKQIYLEELGESIDSMMSDPKQRKEFEAENKLWDCTLSDGLDDAT